VATSTAVESPLSGAAHVQFRNRLAAIASPDQITSAGEFRALYAFHRAARTVSAYASFLRQFGVDANRIRSYQEFRRRVPLTDAGHYLSAFSADEHQSAGVLVGGAVAVETLTGGTFVSDRAERARLRRALRHVLTFLIHAHRRPTLAILLDDAHASSCLTRFADALRALADDRRLTLSVIGPVADITLATDYVRRVTSDVGQVLLVGTDAALLRAVDLPPGASVLRIRHDASPDRRAELVARLRIERPIRFGGRQLLHCVVDSDGWPMAWDSPFTMLASALADRDDALRRAVFGDVRPISLAQIEPLDTWLESIGGRLYVTRSGAIPRIRFRTNLHGAILRADNVNTVLLEHGYDARRLLRALGWPPGVRYPMPLCRIQPAPVVPPSRPSAEAIPAVPKPIVANSIR